MDLNEETKDHKLLNVISPPHEWINIKRECEPGQYISPILSLQLLIK